MHMPRSVWGTVGVVVMAAAAVLVVSLLDEWVGDWGAALWIAAAFMVPYLTGIAWGSGGHGKRGAVVGAAVRALVVVGPGMGYTLVREADPAALNLPLLWTVFTPLAMAQGAIALPVGVSVRKRAAG